MIDEFVERMKNRRTILIHIKEMDSSTNELSKKCEHLITLIDETILIHCSMYN